MDAYNYTTMGREIEGLDINEHQQLSHNNDDDQLFRDTIEQHGIKHWKQEKPHYNAQYDHILHEEHHFEIYDNGLEDEGN